jgi:hypothetical protein
MAPFNRFGVVLALEDGHFETLFGIDDARGKMNGIRALRELPHVEHRRLEG